MTDFTQTRALFDLPEGVCYLDGNSLGPLPKSVPMRIERLMREEWGAKLIGGWTECGWMDLPRRLGERIGVLIGAEPGQTVLGDTLSIKVFQALEAALQLRPDRRVILSDSGNFPSDLYMARGLCQLLGREYELRIVPPHEVQESITEEVAAVLITEVDYRTGARHDMPALSTAAHDAGALIIWDLAHSAGAFAVDVAAGGADFAVGCTYKYLNAGPGAPAFIYVAPRHADHVAPALAGWLGHAAPFEFEPDYRPGNGVARMRVGTPPVLQMAALDAALDIWDEVSLEAVRARSLELGDRFISRVTERCDTLTLATPRAPKLRGSQVSFYHPDARAIMDRLIRQGVVGDYRSPDILRFGITPLYIGEEQIDHAADILTEMLRT